MDLSRLSLLSVTGEGLNDLPEFMVPPADPIALAAQWIARAIESGVREPGTMALATADGTGAPSCRFVLLKGFDERGLLFVTQATSRKGRDIAANPRAAASFYWLEQRLQLHFAGPVAPVSDAESDALFAPRPIGSKAAASVSTQGETLSDENSFVAQIQRLVESGAVIERPARWTGYRLRPERIEFWHGDPARMHRRLEYTRHEAAWRWRRVQP